MADKQDMVSLCAVGDLCVDREKPESIFAHTASTLKEADITFGQLEIMYSIRGTPSLLALSAIRGNPRNVSALTYAGFDILSLASNHCLDWGDDALLDTLDGLQRNGIKTVGAGKNIDEARRPAIFERKGVRIAFLAYNSILPHRYWADTNKPGCAPIRVSTLYEALEHDQPGCPAQILTFAKKEDVEAMKSDIANAKKSAEVVIVSLHWGLHFTPGALATYQPEIGHIAIDAGADLILGHHAHILKGIEVYKGKIIVYSLCNFAFDLIKTAAEFQTPRRRELLKYYPNREYFPDYPSYPFPKDSRMTMLLKASISKNGVEKASFLPVYVNSQGQPEITTRQDERSTQIFNYMDSMSKELGTNLSFEGDEVLIHTS